MKLAEILIEENIDQIFAINADKEIMVWNKACEMATGIKKADIVGKNIFEVIPELKTDKAMVDAIDASLVGYKSFIPHDNLAPYVETQVIPIRNEEEIIGTMILMHDLAYRIKAENELKVLNKSLENFKRIIDSANDVIVTFDLDGNITYWNGAAEKLFGYSPREILGKSLKCLIAEGSVDQLPSIMEALQSNSTIDLIIKQQTKSGNQLEVAASIFPLVDEQNLVVGGCKIAKDITQILNYQKSIVALNKELTIKNRQLESLNLELKTFSDIAVNNYSETLRQLYLHFEYVIANEAGKLSDSGKGNLRKAQAAIQKLKLLTKDIAAFMQLKEFGTELTTLDLNAVVKNIIDDLKENRDVANAEFVTSTLPEIKGYSFLVSLVFHHLLENAVKFKKSKSCVTVSISSEGKIPGSEIDNEAAHSDTIYDVITVRDNGIGFPADQAGNIFQIFTRLHPEKYKGAGVGLAICRKAMELHGGFITAASVEGEGSSFSCYFPVRN